MKIAFVALIASLVCSPAHSACTVDPQFQEISVSSKGKEIKKWKLGSGRQFFTVDNIALSLLVEPASAEVNKKFAVNGNVVSLLSIKLYDERVYPRKLLSSNYGPPNSGHGYGKDGPANGVRQLGESHITVDLGNSSCK